MKKILKLMCVIILLMVILFAIVYFRKVVILIRLNKISKEVNEEFKNNYAVKIFVDSEENVDFIQKEIKVKNNRAIIDVTKLNEDTNEKNRFTTYIISKDCVITVDQTEKSSTTNNYPTKEERSIPKLNRYVFELDDLLFCDIKKDKLDGKNVYIISDEDDILFVDAQNGLIIKSINLSDNITYEYEYDLGSVKRVIKYPNLEKYDRYVTLDPDCFN